MKGRQRYTSLFLILVFVWVLLPAPSLHRLFADHEDTECELIHDYSLTQIESQHTHCDVFSAHGPLYSAPELVTFDALLAGIDTEINTAYVNGFPDTPLRFKRSRGPPQA